MLSYRRCARALIWCGLFIFMGIFLLEIGVVHAIDYPVREIRVIVPYKPGGGSDVRARLVEKIIREKKLLPHPFVVTNMPGGGAAPRCRAYPHQRRALARGCHSHRS